MQYILTEQEYDELVTTKKNKLALQEKELQELCTKIADTMPMRTEASPWGCVLTVESNGGEWYCDECPVQTICPKRYKHWSK
jgi:hypothetical protein